MYCAAESVLVLIIPELEDMAALPFMRFHGACIAWKNGRRGGRWPIFT
jgi:hypothetical protein